MAARLALNSKKVLLIEAGDDQGESLAYQVPVFHAHATEDPAMSWDFYVTHYTNDTRAKTDSKLYDPTSGFGRRILTASLVRGSTQMAHCRMESRTQEDVRKGESCTPELGRWEDVRFLRFPACTGADLSLGTAHNAMVNVSQRL